MADETYNIYNPYNNEIVGSVPIANSSTTDQLLNNIENSNIGKDNSESLNTCIREKLKLIS